MTEKKSLSERLREQIDYDKKHYFPDDLMIEAAERIDRLEAALLLIAIPRVGGGQWASEIARKVMEIENDA